MEVIQAIGWLFSASWDFFTEVNVPGFDFSFAALLVGFFLANLGLRFLFMMLGIVFTLRILFEKRIGNERIDYLNFRCI